MIRTLPVMLTMLTCLLNLFTNNIHAQANIDFKLLHKNFGAVNAQSGDLSYDFVFKNNTDKPVIIKNVVATCGCTVPEWTSQAVLPQQEGKVSVRLVMIMLSGYFSKAVSVYMDGISKPIILQLTGRVLRNAVYSDSFQERLGYLYADHNSLVFPSNNSHSIRDVKFINTRTDTVILKVEEISKGLEFVKQTHELIPPGGNSMIELRWSDNSEDSKGLKCYTIAKSETDTLRFIIPILKQHNN